MTKKELSTLKDKLLSELPTKPSELIDLAIRDFESWTGKVDMDRWFVLDLSGGICSACFAGAMLVTEAKRVTGGSVEFLDMFLMSRETVRYMEFLDHVRMVAEGDTYFTLMHLDLREGAEEDIMTFLESEPVITWEDDPEEYLNRLKYISAVIKTHEEPGDCIPCGSRRGFEAAEAEFQEEDRP